MREYVRTAENWTKDELEQNFNEMTFAKILSGTDMPIGRNVCNQLNLVYDHACDDTTSSGLHTHLVGVSEFHEDTYMFSSYYAQLLGGYLDRCDRIDDQGMTWFYMATTNVKRARARQKVLVAASELGLNVYLQNDTFGPHTLTC
mgnify:CR=1 FL=1